MAKSKSQLKRLAVQRGDSDQVRGLYRKYHVERLHDKTGKHRNCEYFVLDLDHDKHALAALRAYADSCEAEYPLLAADLRGKLRKSV